MSQLRSADIPEGIDELLDARGLGVWQRARGVFIDPDKCWGYYVLESKIVLQSIDEVALCFSITGIDSLLLTVFIVPLVAVPITLLLLVRQTSRGFLHPQKNLLLTHRKNRLTLGLTPSLSHVGQNLGGSDRGGRDREKVRDGGWERLTALQQRSKLPFSPPPICSLGLFI